MPCVFSTIFDSYVQMYVCRGGVGSPKCGMRVNIKTLKKKLNPHTSRITDGILYGDYEGIYLPRNIY